MGTIIQSLPITAEKLPGWEDTSEMIGFNTMWDGDPGYADFAPDPTAYVWGQYLENPWFYENAQSKDALPG
jgi:hypothetical protein